MVVSGDHPHTAWSLNLVQTLCGEENEQYLVVRHTHYVMVGTRQPKQYTAHLWLTTRMRSLQ